MEIVLINKDHMIKLRNHISNMKQQAKFLKQDAYTLTQKAEEIERQARDLEKLFSEDLESCSKASRVSVEYQFKG